MSIYFFYYYLYGWIINKLIEKIFIKNNVDYRWSMNFRINNCWDNLPFIKKNCFCINRSSIRNICIFINILIRFVYVK